MYTINNKNKCTIYNSLLYHDLVDHSIDQTSGSVQIKYSGSSSGSPVSIRTNDITSFIDSSAAVGIWTPAIISDENFVTNKPLFNKQNVTNTILGIENAVNFPALFKNWTIGDQSLNPSSANMVTNWYITSIVPTTYAEYGLLFWYKNNSVTSSSSYLLKDIPNGTLIKSSSPLSYTHTMPSGESVPPTLVDMSVSIDSNTELIKLDNNTLKIVNKSSNNITGSSISFWYEYDKFYLNRCTDFNIDNNTFIIANDGTITKDSKEFSLWISDGEVFSYFDSIANKNKYRSQSLVSKTYLSPFLMPIYREIYHALTLRRNRSISSGLTKNKSILLQKLCYFLSTFPLIDRTTVNVLNSQTIHSAVQTYLDSAQASKEAEITALKTVIGVISNEYNTIHLTDGENKLNNRYNYVNNETGLVKKLLAKYGAQLYVSNNISLKYKSNLPDGPHALFGLSSVTVADKSLASNITLYNNFKLDVGNISYSSDISTTGSVISISGSGFSNNVTVPLADIAITRPSIQPFVLNNNLYKPFTAPETFFRNINPYSDVDGTYYWEQIFGPKCLRFTDYFKDRFRVLRYKTSTDYNPDIYIRQPGTYGLRCTRNAEGVVESDEVFITTDSSFVAPTASAGSATDNNKIINSVPRKIGVHKHGLIWFVDTDHYIKDNYTVRAVSSFGFLDTFRLKDIKIDIPKPENFTPSTSAAVPAFTFLASNGNTKILIDGINIERARYKDSVSSQCVSFYNEKIYRDPRSPFLPILGSNNFVRDNGTVYNLSYFNNTGEIYGRSETLSQPSTASTSLAPPILPYGGYDATKVDAIGIKMPSHNGSRPIPILDKRNDIVDPPDRYCFLKEVKPNNSSNILRKGFFDPLHGFRLANGPCKRRLVFQICNSNGVTDDNFDILVNGTKIGSVDLSAMSKAGSVFIGGAGDIVSADFVCPLDNMTIYRFDPSILREGSNTLEMVNTQRNNHGNYGQIGIRSYLVDGGRLKEPNVLGNLEYRGATGESFSFDFDFKLSDLCPTSFEDVDGNSLVINNELDKQRSFVFKGNGFFSLKASTSDNNLNYYSSSIKLVNNPKSESEQYGNNYGYKTYNNNPKLDANYVIDSYTDPWTSIYDSSTDCGGLTQTTYGFPATGILDNLYLKDLEIKLNFLNYANPKELIVWLDIVSTTGATSNINQMRYRSSSDYSGNTELNTYNSAITNMNSNVTRIYLLNQEHITNYEPNFSVTFSDNTYKYNTTNMQNSSINYQNMGVVPISNNSMIQPTLYATGYNDIDSELYISDIRKNEINNLNCSLLKFKGIPLKDTVFTLNIGFVNPTEYTNKIMDNLLINSLVLTGETTEKLAQSNTTNNSLCSWELKVNTTNTNKFYNTDVLGKINYSNYIYDSLSSAAVSGYNFIGDFQNTPYLVPIAHINAPYNYLANINQCAYDDIIGGKYWSYMRPTAEENMRTLSLAAIQYVLAGMSVLGGAGVGGAVGALMGIYALQAIYERGGRSDPIINFFIETRLLNQTDAQDSQFYKPVYNGKFFGVPDKAIVCISQDENYWYTLEVPIFNMFNSFVLQKQEYNYIKLYDNNIPGISDFEYQTIRNYTDLDLAPIVYTYTSNVSSLSSVPSGFSEGDMVLLVGQDTVSDNGYYIIGTASWIKVPSVASSYFLRNNNISSSFTDGSLSGQTHILINGARAYHFFDKNENVVLNTTNGTTNATIADKSYIQTSSGIKTVLTLNIAVAKNGTVSKNINEANVLWIYKQNLGYSDSEAVNKWLLAKTKNDKAENIDPLNFASAYGEGSMNSGSDILDPDILYKLSFKHSELPDTNKLLNNEANDKYKFNKVFLSGVIQVPPPPPPTSSSSNPNDDAGGLGTPTATGAVISFADSDTGTSLLKGYSSTLENFLSKPLYDIAINTVEDNVGFRLANTVFDIDWSDKQFLEIKSDKFKGSGTIPLKGSLHIENDFKKIMPVYLSSGDLSTISSRLSSLSNNIIPGLYSTYYSLPQDPVSCYSSYNDATCPKTAAYQQIKIKEAEKTDLEGALALPASQDGYIPYVSGIVSSATDGTVTVKYSINPYLYWIHIDPDQQCELNDELSVKVLEKIRMRAIPLSEVNNEGITIFSASHIVPLTAFNGIPSGLHNTSGVSMKTEGLVYSYIMGSGTIADAKTQWSTGIGWGNPSKFTYGGLGDSGDSKKLMISRLDSSKDMLVITEENYLRPSGIITAGKIKDFIDFSQTNIYLKFRNIPRKLKSIDSEDFERYIYDRNGNLIRSSMIMSSVGQVANNFTCWHCIDSSGNFTALPPYYQAANEMRYRAFFGSSDGMENKNSLFLDTKEDWEWIPYEYYTSSSTNSSDQTTIDFLNGVQALNRINTSILNTSHFSIMNLNNTNIQTVNNDDDDMVNLLYGLNYEKYFQTKYRFQIQYRLINTYYTGDEYDTLTHSYKPKFNTVTGSVTSSVVLAVDQDQAQKQLQDSVTTKTAFSKISDKTGKSLVFTHASIISTTQLPRLPSDIRYSYISKPPFPPSELDTTIDKLTTDRFIDFFEHLYFADQNSGKYPYRITILANGQYAIYRYYDQQWTQLDDTSWKKSINIKSIYEAAKAPLMPFIELTKTDEYKNNPSYKDSIDKEMLKIENSWVGGITLYYKMMYEAFGGQISVISIPETTIDDMEQGQINIYAVGSCIIQEPAWFEKLYFTYDKDGNEPYPVTLSGDLVNIRHKFGSAQEILWNSTKDLTSIDQRITRVTQGSKLPIKQE